MRAHNTSGPTNKKLRVHLPLVTPGAGLARLRVGSQTREVRLGQALIFDDSFEHEAWNDSSINDSQHDTVDSPVFHDDRNNLGPSSVTAPGRENGIVAGRNEAEEVVRAPPPEEIVASGPRVILVADVWHPDLTRG